MEQHCTAAAARMGLPPSDSPTRSAPFFMYMGLPPTHVRAALGRQPAVSGGGGGGGGWQHPSAQQSPQPSTRRSAARAFTFSPSGGTGLPGAPPFLYGSPLTQQRHHAGGSVEARPRSLPQLAQSPQPPPLAVTRHSPQPQAAAELGKGVGVNVPGGGAPPADEEAGVGGAAPDEVPRIFGYDPKRLEETTTSFDGAYGGSPDTATAALGGPGPEPAVQVSLWGPRFAAGDIVQDDRPELPTGASRWGGDPRTGITPHGAAATAAVASGAGFHWSNGSATAAAAAAAATQDPRTALAIRQLRDKIQSRLDGGPGWTRRAFRLFDRDGDGSIDYDEFSRILKRFLNLRFDKVVNKAVFDAFDDTGDGRIDYRKFHKMVCHALVEVGTAACSAWGTDIVMISTSSSSSSSSSSSACLPACLPALPGRVVVRPYLRRRPLSLGRRAWAVARTANH
eukprot:SAG25_NODE_491_length_7415_cov_6.908557_5_plen_452_part_00